MRPGDIITVFDGSGSERSATLVEVTPARVTAALGEPRRPGVEPRLELTICQSLIRPERFELILEKCTELGVSRFIPLRTGRVQSADSSGPSPARLTRWRRIVEEAAEQSGRTRVPEIEAPRDLAGAVTDQLGLGPVLVLWEEERAAGLVPTLRRLAANRPRALTLVIGPVGGLTDAEVSGAVSQGAVAVSIGPRVLRAETAAIAGVALALSELGELIPPGAPV
jgi:16S rRNA (uracil1498-N3)-methyltransferase